MKYRNQKVKDVDSRELLFELIQREKTIEAPQKTERFAPHTCVIVSITPDDIAEITIADDTRKALEDFVAEHDAIPRSNAEVRHSVKDASLD